jgi:hypothetical protein
LALLFFNLGFILMPLVDEPENDAEDDDDIDYVVEHSCLSVEKYPANRRVSTDP